MEKNGDPPEKSFSASTSVGVRHCGAGCTPGDIIGATFVFLIGWEIAGMALWPEYIVDYTLAFAVGIAFQYYSIKPMQGLSPGRGIIAALKADTLSDFVRDRSVRVDGDNAVRVVPGRHSSEPRHLLVSYADRYDFRLLYGVPGQLVAHQTWHQRADVGAAFEWLL